MNCHWRILITIYNLVGTIAAVVRKFSTANQRHSLRVICYAVAYAFAIVVIHSLLGGWRQAGGAIVWIFIAPPLILMSHRPRTGVPCSIMIAVLIGFLLIANPWVANHSLLPAQIVVKLLVINMAGFALFLWFTVGLYIWRHELQARSNMLAVAYERSQLALRDSLTGIPNREGAKQVCPSKFPLTVLVIDLDRFKAINAALGRGLGDQALIMFAQRLLMLDFVSLGRLHADRFVTLLPGEPGQDQVEELITSVLNKPLEIDVQVIDLSATVGLARCLSPAELELTMRNAETALTVARNRHRRCLEYCPQMQQDRRGDLSLISDLNRAMTNQEFRMYLQPKVLLRDGTVESAEALIRWQHPSRGMVAPMDFIPFAEQTGLIRGLTNWILREAMRETVRRRESGEPLQISVNVFAAELADPNFETAVLTLAKQTNVCESDIRFEVTESGLMEQPEVALLAMTRLQTLGFSWSIDDFGTGFSSLSHLQKMPVAELKIDRAFVTGLGGDQHNSKLLRSAIRMGHELGLSVVCEGAETAEEWDCLLELGADYGQGWHASPPLPAGEFDEWRRLRVAERRSATGISPSVEGQGGKQLVSYDFLDSAEQERILSVGMTCM